ncbi:MAG: glycosyltransferase family 2 protein [Cytophagales bacterium]|nr:glycosyltransferase family 2 protein [Armatimonadota bacterium]
MTKIDSQPLLSICVPTYNRSAWLRASLDYALPQVLEANGEVELIVSDNCSTDDTPVLVRALQEKYPLRYLRNGENIGFLPNMARVTTEAVGKFIWVMGDDDFLRPGALRRVLDVIRHHSDVSMIHINYSSYPVSGPPTGLIPLSEFEKLTHRMRQDTSSRYVEKVKELVAGDENCFTPIYATVFQKIHGAAAFQSCLQYKQWEHAESVIPHAFYVAHNMLELPAYYVGDPFVVTASDTSWSKYLAGYYMIYLPQLYKLLEGKGADRKALNEHRLATLKQIHQVGGFRKMLLDGATPMRNQFSLRTYLKTYFPVPGTKKILLKDFVEVINESLRSALWSFRPTRFLLHRVYLAQTALRQRVSRQGG